MSQEATVRHEGGDVLLVLNGKVTKMPPSVAKQLAQVLRHHAAKADEYIHANRIIADHALLTRAGFPVGLSDNPRIKDQVRQEAAWNSELRKALPGGVKSREVFGVPKLILSK